MAQTIATLQIVEVFADITCPFTHVGLRRFVDRRDELGRDDVVLRVRAWPLELVNGQPHDVGHIARVVADLRRQVAPNLFTGFDPETFPTTSIPALALATAASMQDLRKGERVNLELRDLLFERGVDVNDPGLIRRLATCHRLDPDLLGAGAAEVRRDLEEGRQRGVIGSPHFFTPDGDFFCPALDIHRDADGTRLIAFDPDRYSRFLTSAFAV
jgi:predicted DsbA family dithiol-disulfide isomerase